MTSKKVTLLLAASIFLTGATGAFIGSMTSAHAITSVDELTDVNPNHWAYEALRDLVERYDVIEGYPDHTFRGERAATRWEMAAALNALIRSVGRDLARLGAEKADRADLEALARLQEEFRNELSALQARTDALESRAAAIEAKNAEQDQRLSLLERTQLHGDMSFGIISDIRGTGTRDEFSGRNNGRDGIRDGISAIGRLRLTMDVPVREDRDDSLVGEGKVHTRLIAAFGRIAPSGVQQNGAGPWTNYNSYSRIASDASLFNEGVGVNSLLAGPDGAAGAVQGGTNVRTNLYVENVHYHQHFKAGIPLLTDWTLGGASNDPNWATTGDLYVGIVPWRYLYDKSPYRGNELTQFQNTAFVNTPGTAINQNIPMVAYQWHQMLGSEDLSLDVTTGLGTIDVGDAMNGLNLTYEGRLNYKVFDLPGSIYGGGYHVWNAGSRNYNNNGYFGSIGNFSPVAFGATSATAPLNRSGGPTGLNYHSPNTLNSFYLGWNQEWYEGIGTTFNYLWNGRGRNNYFLNSNNQMLGASLAQVRTGFVPNGVGGGSIYSPVTVGVRQALSAVVHIPMRVFGVRENDTLGFGYAYVDLYKNRLGTTAPNLSRRTRFNDGVEHTMEAYYKWAVNDAISIVPSIQIINNNLGVTQNGVTTVLGLRTNYTF